MNIETVCAQSGNRRDSRTGSISVPVYHATTYAHPGLGQSTGFDYTRTANPTRIALEETIATLHHGLRGFAFASGMAAVDCVCRLFRPGDHVLLSEDLYGGTHRLFANILAPLGIRSTYVDTTDIAQLEAAIESDTKALFLESPSNPTMRVSSIADCATVIHRHGARLIVDNTFMTPYLQQPLDLGADIVLESATKYLGGHNDVLAGVVVVSDVELAEQLFFYQNSIGAVLGPQDAWLLLRGLKTLTLRMDRHEENASRIAHWLTGHPAVGKVYYPGLESHPHRTVHESQAKGYGGMISFEVRDAEYIEPFLERVRLVTFAESLGGVESLVTYPVRQTHCDIPPELRERFGVTDRLLRLSVGVEHHEDLIADLQAALTSAAREVAV